MVRTTVTSSRLNLYRSEYILVFTKVSLFFQRYIFLLKSFFLPDYLQILAFTNFICLTPKTGFIYKRHVYSCYKFVLFFRSSSFNNLLYQTLSFIFHNMFNSTFFTSENLETSALLINMVCKCYDVYLVSTKYLSCK